MLRSTIGAVVLAVVLLNALVTADETDKALAALQQASAQRGYSEAMAMYDIGTAHSA